MRRFAYLGDHASVTLWGIDFPQGVAVAVEDAHALRKLEGNSHFAEVFDGVEVIVGEQQPKRRGRPPKVKP